MSALATEKQISYLRALAAKAGADFDTARTLTIAEASRLIVELRARAAVVAPPAPAPVRTSDLVAEGVYRRSSDGAMFRVQTSQDSERRYAKLLLPAGGWGYERGAIFTLTAGERLTLEQLEEWGLSTGVCAICGRLLSTAESVARGIGPVCAKRY